MEYKCNNFHISFHEFNQFLSDEIKEQYPDVELLMIKGGDSIFDIEMEVRRRKGSFRYRPFALYQKDSFAGEILENKIKCKRCGEVIESKTLHDFKYCKCKSVAVDGGHDYLKRIGYPEDWKELSKCTEENYEGVVMELIKKIDLL